ncbi:MAG: class I SAM-dependent rRNA methyltransferase [Bacteroidia bacterium]|nr:class I SAM-dependent rRNA methyltransferase [Sphingobacteriaceae bacterium]MBP9068798.1 class I SAM-dependent rRNA methyltransferase [Bacteroidia bacterium]
MYSKIVLNKDKEHSLQRFHPWVFSGAIKVKEANLKDGALVEVYSSTNKFLGIGYYANGSIAVRIISFEQVAIDEAFWINKISKAYEYRKQIGVVNENTNVYRLFFGEGDGVPALIIDNYNGHIVIQSHNIGVHLQRENIVAAIKKVLGSDLKTIYDKSSETISGKNNHSDVKNEFLFGDSENTIVKENGVQFLVDWTKGQKTGFFIDQRDNRKLLSEYSKGKTVLNTFSYTGGFSVYAALAGAKEVHSVDVSAPAIEIGNKNIELNGAKNHTSFVEDTFDFFKDKKDMYDVIVLDPPAFAKSRDAKHQAINGYKRLNALAMKLIKKGGIIFTFSCSGVVDKYLFYNTITAAAIESKRNIRVLHYLNQPADHPVTPYFPEGEYLKGMVLWVE